MKFTEGYWLMREDLRQSYAAQAYDAEAFEGGMRIYAPCKPVRDRGDTLNIAMLTVEFTSPAEGVIAVRAYHHAGYRAAEPSFEKKTDPQSVTVEIGEEEALMTAGSVAVRVDRKRWRYRIEGAGKVLTEGGWRGLGFIDEDNTPRTVMPGGSYFQGTGKPRMMAELSLDVGECVYGLGERFSAFVKNGQQLDTWNEDGGTSSSIAYKCIPFYLTNRGYGVLVDHTGDVSFEIASEKVERVGFSVPGEEIRFLVFYGPTPRDVLRRYTRMTGRAPLPPAWSFGLWLSTSFTTSYDEKTVTSMIQGMEDRKIPLSVFHFDCFWMREFNWCDFEWDKRNFSDPKGMLRRYKDRGLKIDVWINPYLAQRSPLFAEAAEKGYLLMRADGRGVRQTDSWQAGMALVDFTNPGAYGWFQEKLEKLLDLGVDCFKTDFGERIPLDVRYYDGSSPESMHNYYTYLYNRCVYEVLQRHTGEAVLFARSATVGSQKFPVHWGGDCSANYPSMAETLRGGLSFMMSGFSFWSHDIAGFEDTASPDVYKRWAAFGLLSTHSRLHGSTSYRVPWLFDEEACRVLRSFTELKCRLMPYLYRMSALAGEEGTPVMRPMAFEFSDDPAADYLDRQYMLGDSLLVAPVFSSSGAVDYYLPKGRWTHLLSGEEKEGGRWYRDQCDYFTLPLYVRPNTLLAMGSESARPDYEYSTGLRLQVYGLEDGKTASCDIPDLHGKTVLTARASRSGEEVLLTLSAPAKDASVTVHWGEGRTCTAAVEGLSARISLR